jgi:hypothetical protein
MILSNLEIDYRLSLSSRRKRRCSKRTFGGVSPGCWSTAIHFCCLVALFILFLNHQVCSFSRIFSNLLDEDRASSVEEWSQDCCGLLPYLRTGEFGPEIDVAGGATT